VLGIKEVEREREWRWQGAGRDIWSLKNDFEYLTMGKKKQNTIERFMRIMHPLHYGSNLEFLRQYIRRK
jgi:hypothetical protein